MEKIEKDDIKKVENKRKNNNNWFYWKLRASCLKSGI